MRKHPEFYRLWLRGLTVASVAEELGTSENAIHMRLHRYRKKLGPEAVYRQMTEADNADFIRRWNKGESTRELAERFGYRGRADVRQRAFTLRKQGHKLTKRIQNEKKTPIL